MVPSGPPTPVGGAQPVSPSLLRTNSSQQPFSSLVPPHTQFNSNGGNSSSNMGLMGNISNAMLFRSHSFGPGSGGRLSAPPVNLQQRGGVGGDADVLGSSEHDPRSFTSSSGRLHGQHLQNPSASQDHSQPQQLEGLHDFQQQQQFLRGGGSGNVGGTGPVKLEPQLGPTDQDGPPQHLQSARSLGAVKIEPQQLQSMRSLGAAKFEHQHSDSSLFLLQQQQQFLQMSRQSSQAAAAQINLLQQQRMLQQQQILKTMPQQRTHLLQQVQQGVPARPQGKPIVYEPGMCARRLTHYMYHQQHRPEDNNIEFWRKFVAEYFAPNAKKRWCVSLYGSGRQTTGVFPQDGWHCEICNRKPGRGFETTVEVLPRLFQIKYASGTLEELLYIDMPHEYQNASGQIVLDYAKAVQESVLEQLRVVREGQLRVVFSPDLKICSWEFCARRHEELIPRRLLISQVSQLGSVVQKYQNAAQNASSGLPAQDLQNTCNSFVASARQLAKALEVPLVNDLGYTKRYVRCLQISEVVNSMKDLIDYSKETGTGPMDSLINFPRRTSASSGLHAQQAQQPEEQQNVSHNPYHNGQNSIHAAGMQLASASNGVTSVNNSHGAPSSTSMSATNAAGLLHQNSMNSRQENPMGCASSPYSGGNTVQMPSASSSNSLPPPQPNPSSPFLPSPTPSTSNNIATPTSHGGAQLNPPIPPANMSAVQPQATQPHEADPTESQSSVQKILQEMLSSRSNGFRALGNEMKGAGGITPALNGGSYLMGNGAVHNSSVTGTEFGSTGGIGSHATSNGLRSAMANNSMLANGRVGMNHIHQGPMPMNHHQQQQQDMGNRLLGGQRSANSFSNLQFDWKTSP